MSMIGVVLILLGAALAVAEAHVPSGGVLGGAAIAAVVGGIVLVRDRRGCEPRRRAGGRARRRCGRGGLPADRAVRGAGRAAPGSAAAPAARRPRRRGPRRARPARPGVPRRGAVARRLWLADDAALQRGDPIVVEHVDGLTLTVRRAEVREVAP